MNTEEKVMVINGINVRYIGNVEDGTARVNPDDYFKASLEGSVRKCLDFQESDLPYRPYVESLYRIILLCGEYENPYVDELVLKDFLQDEERVFALINKYPQVNAEHWHNQFDILNFSLEDKELIRKCIEILKRSFTPRVNPY